MDSHSWVADIPFETHGPAKRAFKKLLLNPLANYLPASWLRGLLRFGKSELAQANWTDPGGWRSMVISYSGQCRQVADRILVGGGTVPTALRNRKRLAARLISRLIDNSPASTPHVLCLGAGPGQIISEALRQARRPAEATLVDISSDAFEFGRELASKAGVADRVRFVQADVRDIEPLLDRPPDIVKMIGICEYLTDEQVVSIVEAIGRIAPEGSWIVSNSISPRHGTDRFFRRVFGLHMNHRTPEHLQGLLGRGGFGQFASYLEPLGVYHVMLGRKVDQETSAAKG